MIAIGLNEAADALKTPHIVFLPVVLLRPVDRQGSQKSMDSPNEHFRSHDQPLTYELVLDILPLDIHAKIKVRCLSVPPESETDGDTDTHTHR